MTKIAAALTIFVLAGCGATKIVEKERVQTVTVTRRTTVEQTRTVRPPRPQPRVYVASDEGVLYKPVTMSYYGGAQMIEKIRWLSYGGPTAVGRAVYGFDTCNPSCAGGKYIYTPFTLKLLDRQLCHGAIAYTEWEIVGVHGVDPSPAPIARINNPCGSE